MTPEPTPEERAEWALERAAVLHCALRHLAAHVHRGHAKPADPSWTHCENRWCRMAHDAVEGRYVARTVTEHGRVVSLRKKEA